MAKKSFAPKLNQNEADALQHAPREWSGWMSSRLSDAEYSCVARGLLAFEEHFEWGIDAYGNSRLAARLRYRLSKRGELMLARWQRQQADTRFRAQLREEGAA